MAHWVTRVDYTRVEAIELVKELIGERGVRKIARALQVGEKTVYRWKWGYAMPRPRYMAMLRALKNGQEMPEVKLPKG